MPRSLRPENLRLVRRCGFCHVDLPDLCITRVRGRLYEGGKAYLDVVCAACKHVLYRVVVDKDTPEALALLRRRLDELYGEVRILPLLLVEG